MKRIIDTHTHIYVEDFNQDLADVIERARSVGLYKLFLPNINGRSVEQMLRVCEQYPDFCHPMIGLHPTDVGDDYQSELLYMKRLLDDDVKNGNKQFIAVGEIGVDLYWDNSTLKSQIDAFATQIEWGIEYNLPLSIHSRSAFDELCSVMDRYKDASIRGVFHCFSGNAEQAAKLLEYPGFMLGVGGTVTYKKSELPEVLKTVPVDRILLETDAPYLPPVPFRGKRNEPAYLKHVVDFLATVYSIDAEQVMEITTLNAERLFL